MLDAVLFDLDGTLADTIPLIVASWNAAVGPITGLTYSLEDVISRFGPSDSGMIRRELPEEAVWRDADEMYHAYYRKHHGKVVVFDGVPEMLAAVRATGLPVGLMTGKGRRSADITLAHLGWAGTFDAIVTGDEAEKPKPNPEPLIQVARMLGVDPRKCAYVGDSPADVKAGRAAGMKTIAAGWHAVYAEKVRALRPEHWAEHPSEVVRIVQE
ncbi:MAG: HAD family hydrolase [Phycisphaerae bacterium]|nr:HAD family hydrolase [Tepidisphaeraceae bacterium]